MPQELIQLDSRRLLTKIASILLLVAATFWSYFAIRWYVGNTMAEYFNTGENNLELAQIAKNLAPSDPLTHWRLGQVSQKQLPLDQAAAALTEYEKAVSLSPNDYRLWMNLGTAREQTGDSKKAEAALRQAVDLAPSYAYPHWYLGNLLLRNNRFDEAFAELRKASDADPEELQPQFFNLIWQVYGDDLESLEKTLGPNARIRAEFSNYLLGIGRFDEGLKIWNLLGADEKKTNKDMGDSMVKMLIPNFRFHDALSVWKDTGPRNSHLVELGKITDGSFEEIASYSEEPVFGWNVKNGIGVQIGIDPGVSHSGARSLRMLFQVRANSGPISATQLVVVAPDTSYDFECYVRTEKLESGGTPFVQIVDAGNGAVLAASEYAPNGTNEWSRIAFTFKTTAQTEAVTLRIIRADCGEDVPVCPIFGAVWYDDFSFKRNN
jgi:tetratricopeptide (TPR) repeat protein